MAGILKHHHVNGHL